MNGKIIFSARLARKLIRKGFKLIDIKPNKDNHERTVFVFENTYELNKIINKNKIIKNTDFDELYDPYNLSKS